MDWCHENLSDIFYDDHLHGDGGQMPNSENQLVTTNAGLSSVLEAVPNSENQLVTTNAGLSSGLEAVCPVILNTHADETYQNQLVDSVHTHPINDVDEATDRLEKKRKKGKEYRERIKENKKRLEEDLKLKLQEQAALHQNLQSANANFEQLMEIKKKLEEDLQVKHQENAALHQNLQSANVDIENKKKLVEDLQVKLQENAALHQNLQSANVVIENYKRLEEDLQVKLQSANADIENYKRLEEDLQVKLQSANADIADRKKAEEELLQKLQSANTTIEKLEQQLEGTQSVSHQLVLPEIQVKLQENAALNQNLQSANAYIFQLLEKKKKLEEDLQVKLQENATLHQNLQSANADIADRKKAEEEKAAIGRQTISMSYYCPSVELLLIAVHFITIGSVLLQKAVLEVDIKDKREMQKVLEVAGSFSGIDSIAISATEKKLTITSDDDPVDIVNKLRNTWNTLLLSFGLAKEEKKKEE